jgi:hypothetical protein
MGRKYVGAGWVLVQDGDRLLVRQSWAGHIAGVALLLVFGTAASLGACVGLWRLTDSKDAGAFLCLGLFGVFWLAFGVMLLVRGETPCILDRQSGTMHGRPGLMPKVVCRLDEVTTNVEQYEWWTVFTKGPAYRVRLHPEVALGGFSTPESAEALASGIREWLRKV